MVLYVAVVRDTDGSAFITKAEFDSLKNNFQAQIDNYNSSIDSKIDGAIASYLAGIKLATQEELENIYDSLGGTNIKWKNVAWTDIKPEPGFALYGTSCSDVGYGANYQGASYGGIKDINASAWTSSASGGTYGTFNVWRYGDSGEKYLTLRAVNKMCKNIAMMAWFNGSTHATKWDYPLGPANAKPELGTPIPGTGMEFSCVDVYLSIVIPSNKKDSADIDYSYTTFDTVPNSSGIGISSDRFNYGDVYVSKGNFTSTTFTGGTPNTVKFKYTYARNWETVADQNYSEWYTGFCQSGKYKQKLYEGVQLFKASNNDGTVQVANIKFSNYIADVIADGDILFAIRDSGFSNSETLNGNVTLENLPAGVTVHDAANHIYKVAQGTPINFTFQCTANTEYFIKLRKETRSTENADYITMDSGATVTYTAAA